VCACMPVWFNVCACVHGVRLGAGACMTVWFGACACVRGVWLCVCVCVRACQCDWVRVRGVWLGACACRSRDEKVRLDSPIWQRRGERFEMKLDEEGATRTD